MNKYTVYDGRAIIDRVLESTDIEQLIAEDLNLRKRGNHLEALCPFHSENTPSFQVIPSKGFFYCHGCGATGDAIGWLQQYKCLKFGEALKQLAERAGIITDKPSAQERRVLARCAKRAELERALDLELTVLSSVIGVRVDGRKSAPPDWPAGIAWTLADTWEREQEAAKRIHKALTMLYGL